MEGTQARQMEGGRGDVRGGGAGRSSGTGCFKCGEEVTTTFWSITTSPKHFVYPGSFLERMPWRGWCQEMNRTHYDDREVYEVIFLVLN